MQAVQKCLDADELLYKKDKDGTELWGMPKRRIQSGKRITTEVSFAAFKNIKDKKLVHFVNYMVGCVDYPAFYKMMVRAAKRYNKEIMADAKASARAAAAVAESRRALD